MSILRIFDSARMKNVSAKGLIVVFRIVSVSVDCCVFGPENKGEFLTVRSEGKKTQGKEPDGVYFLGK